MNSPETACDSAHTALQQEIVDLNGEIRTQSFALLGPIAFPPDLTMRQLHVLFAAEATGGLTVHEVAQELGVTTPTASGMVDRLADKGLVIKSEDPSDRRIRHVNLTEQGEAALTLLDSAFARLLGEMLSLLTHDELVAFRDNSQFMVSMIERLREHRQPAG